VNINWNETDYRGSGWVKEKPNETFRLDTSIRAVLCGYVVPQFMKSSVRITKKSHGFMGSHSTRVGQSRDALGST